MTVHSLKHYLAISLCLFVLTVAVQSASAHRVNVFAWVDGDTIHVESKFSGGKKVKTGKVVVMDPRSVELLSGFTNDQGEFSFKVPGQSDLRIIIMAGQGHQGEWTVRKAELQGALPETMEKRDVVKELNSEPQSDTENISADVTSAMTANDIRPEDLEAMIESILDRKLQPITHMLADIRQEGPDVGDIFAGIGYILGLVGIAVYVQNRKNKV
jgi:nickel transport protein